MVVRGDGYPGEFSVAVGGYVLGCVPAGLPPLFNQYAEHAELVDRFALDNGNLCCLTVRAVGEPWPFVVITQNIDPVGGGFEPGLLLVEETARLFVGAGARLLAYDLRAPARLFEARVAAGFWGWERHGDIVLMSSEIELRAFSIAAEPLWSRSVEPPWYYEVRGDEILIDVMGERTTGSIRTGVATETGG